MESRFIDTPSGKFHAMVAGQGEAVILVHGYGQVNSWRTWEKNIDALARDFRVYGLDLLGYGESDKPEVGHDALFEAVALIELLDAEQIPSANWIGLSWGGGIVEQIAIQAPERVDRMVLVDAAFDQSEEGLEQLHSIDTPTLILWDQQDQVIPVEMANVLAGAIPHSELEVLTAAQRDPDANPNEKHWTQLTHSKVFNRLVAQFLKRPLPGARTRETGPGQEDENDEGIRV